MQAVLAPADQGGLPLDSVIVSNWYDSTTLWYGQKVEGLRPDIYIVDDTMRVRAGENLGQVWNVIDTYLGRQPVFLLRFAWNCDGFTNLAKYYVIQEFRLPNNHTIKQVTGKIGPVSCSCSCRARFGRWSGWAGAAFPSHERHSAATAVRDFGAMGVDKISSRQVLAWVPCRNAHREYELVGQAVPVGVQQLFGETGADGDIAL